MKINQGFTLVELLVVIFIVGFLTTMSIATVVSAKQKRQTSVAADLVKNALIEAHAYAISPKTAAGTGTVDIIIAAHTIDAKVGATKVITTVTVPSNITLKCATGAAAGTCLSFITNDANKMGQVPASGRDIVATNTTGEKYKVSVGSLSGNVTITKL